MGSRLLVTDTVVVQSLSHFWCFVTPMDCSMPGFPVLHYLLAFAQTHVHWVSDAIQPSSSVTLFSTCPQSSPASGFFPVSPLFASGGQSIGALASVLPMNIQGWFPLGLTGLILLLSEGLLRVFSRTTMQKHPLWFLLKNKCPCFQRSKPSVTGPCVHRKQN